jgi:WhiB family redox-sensing transcriptional regulator
MDAFDFMAEMPQFSEASCKNIMTPNLFFPETKKQEATSLPIVRLICDGCTHRKECLEYAQTHKIFHGIWGGLTPEERGDGRTKRDWSGPNRAKRIRKLSMRGLAPETVAREVGVSLDYVKQVVKRARNKGEIQSDQSNTTWQESS